MPILYLDEDVKYEIAHLLVASDRSLRTARDEGRLGASDPFQLIYAAEQGWTVVTCNRNDYHLLHDAWLLWSHRWAVTQVHAGILALDQGHPTTVMVEAISDFLRTAPSLVNAMFDWTARDGLWKPYQP